MPAVATASDDTIREDSTHSLGDPAPEPDQSLPAGGRIGPYRLIEALGRGGMGAVWKAEAAESCPVPAGRQVALKLLHRISPEERRRAAREVAYLQALHHPGVVRILDFGEHAGRPWIVMSLVEGRRLDKVMAEEAPFASDRAARIAVGALEALHVAHLAGILHRDVKPGNLMLKDDGQVVVLDFGLAAAPEYESRLTASDTVIGTPAYMSPEQARGERAAVSARSDVYAMGAVLYEMVCGSAPFSADDPRALLREVIERPLSPPSLRRAGLPRDLETVVLRAMAKDPADRYRSAELMAADLRRFLDGRAVRATRPGPIRPFLRSCWRRRRTVALLGLICFVLAGGAVLATRAALIRLRPPEVVPANTGPEWVTELVQVEPLLPPSSPGGGKLRTSPRPSFGPGFHLAHLPAVAGPVRLAATLTVREPAFEALLMVSDRDIGRGYAARLAGTADSARLELLRDGKPMAGRDLPAIKPGSAMRLAMVRSEESLEVRLSDDAGAVDPVSFLDLVPLEGPDAAGTFVAADPAAVQISELVLERQRSGLTVSALAPADMLRQDGRFERALSIYDAFLADHPDSPLARDADLRASLCLEALDRDQLALDRFVRVAQEHRLDRRYVTLATFHAWACALRLGKLDDAERFFAALRRDYRADQILAHVPVDAARKLVDDHLTRAEALRATDLPRALDLFTAGADVAVYLGLNERAALALTGAGDVLLGLDDPAAALQRYRAVADAETMPAAWRLKARLKSAEALRLSDRPAEAKLVYRAVAEDPAAGDLAPWAWLWLGDLLNELGEDTAANEAWSNAVDDPGMAGRFARALLGLAALPAESPTDPWYANDDAFVRARLAQRAGDPAAAIEHLRTAAAGDWPAPLARRLLSPARTR
jgi:tetratricopeptide (TPR) repeat protein/predicted Ser/Thr protein kinase